jgi:hypothetical protein
MQPSNTNKEHPLWPFDYYNRALDMGTRKDGLVALHDRVQTTTTTLDGKKFTANIVQRHGCYQPTPMGNTPYGHSIIITELLTWVPGRMGLVALHDRVQTTTTTSDGKTFTDNKVQRHGCYHPTPIRNTPYGHSIIITELLTWVQGRMD